MAENDSNTLSGLGEFGLIRKITGDFIRRHPSTRKGVGDDCAVIGTGNQVTLVTTDLLLEGIHFDLTYVPLRHLGYKSVVVNLSDVYAMNGIPKQITASIGFSSKLNLEAIEELYRGIRLACEQYDIDLIGGDTSASMHGLTISVTALGTASENQVVYRSGAKKGDIICVTGDLGGAFMGLMLLEEENKKFMEHSGYRPELGGFPYLLERQLKPEACRNLGILLRSAGVKPTSMIDISDGLSSDLMHLCEESGTGSRIVAARVPVHQETVRMADRLQMSPLAAALNGGEDYELLFTVSQADIRKVEGLEGVSTIGVMTGIEDGNLIEMKDRSVIPMEPRGWNAGRKWKEL